MTAFCLVGAIVSEVVATLSMKASRGFTRKLWLIPVVLGYGTAFGLIGTLLGRGGMSVGVVYAIWSSSGVALSAICGRVIFREPITRFTGMGIGLIVAGVALVEAGA